MYHWPWRCWKWAKTGICIIRVIASYQYDCCRSAYHVCCLQLVFILPVPVFFPHLEISCMSCLSFSVVVAIVVGYKDMFCCHKLSFQFCPVLSSWTQCCTCTYRAQFRYIMNSCAARAKMLADIEGYRSGILWHSWACSLSHYCSVTYIH